MGNRKLNQKSGLGIQAGRVRNRNTLTRTRPPTEPLSSSVGCGGGAEAGPHLNQFNFLLCDFSPHSFILRFYLFI